jgi:hypothetical protein
MPLRARHVPAEPARGQQQLRRLEARQLRLQLPPRPTAAPRPRPSMRPPPPMPHPSPRVQQRDQVVVAPLDQQRVRQHRTGRDGLHDLAPDDPLRLRRILHLLADRHAPTEADQPLDVLVAGPRRHARQRHVRRAAVVARRQRQAQQLRALLGVLAEHLVEVADAEEDSASGWRDLASRHCCMRGCLPASACGCCRRIAATGGARQSTTGWPAQPPALASARRRLRAPLIPAAAACSHDGPHIPASSTPSAASATDASFRCNNACAVCAHRRYGRPRQVPVPLDTLYASRPARASLRARRPSLAVVDVFDRAAIEALPARTVADVIARALGADLRPRSPAQADLSIRGGSFEQILVLIDGVRRERPADRSLPSGCRCAAGRGGTCRGAARACVRRVRLVCRRRCGQHCDTSRRFRARRPRRRRQLRRSCVRRRCCDHARRSARTRRCRLRRRRRPPRRHGPPDATRTGIALRSARAGRSERRGRLCNARFRRERFLRAVRFVGGDAYGHRVPGVAQPSGRHRAGASPVVPSSRGRLHPSARRSRILPERTHHTRVGGGAGGAVARGRRAVARGGRRGAPLRDRQQQSRRSRSEDRTAAFVEAAVGRVSAGLVTLGLRLDHHSAFGSFISSSLAAGYRVSNPRSACAHPPAAASARPAGPIATTRTRPTSAHRTSPSSDSGPPNWARR